MKQAGYDGKRARTSFVISTSGSGQMLPLAMNEFVQENLREIGIEVELVPIEWNALTVRGRKGFRGTKRADRSPISPTTSSSPLAPSCASSIAPLCRRVPPNITGYINPAADRLIEAAEASFETQARDETLGKLHELSVDDAPWIFVVHDLNPRAMSPKVKGFVPPQSWFVDLTLPWVEK